MISKSSFCQLSRVVCVCDNMTFPGKQIGYILVLFIEQFVVLAPLRYYYMFNLVSVLLSIQSFIC